MGKASVPGFAEMPSLQRRALRGAGEKPDLHGRDHAGELLSRRQGEPQSSISADKDVHEERFPDPQAPPRAVKGTSVGLMSSV